VFQVVTPWDWRALGLERVNQRLLRSMVPPPNPIHRARLYHAALEEGEGASYGAAFARHRQRHPGVTARAASEDPMQALSYEGPWRATVKEKADPRIEHPQDGVVRVETAAICGSDLHILHGMIPDPWQRPLGP
jgi:hypothetical protein